MYDAILSATLHQSASIVGFAHDTALVAVDRRFNIPEMKYKDAPIISPEKTEAILISQCIRAKQ